MTMVLKIGPASSTGTIWNWIQSSYHQNPEIEEKSKKNWKLQVQPEKSGTGAVKQVLITKGEKKLEPNFLNLH